MGTSALRAPLLALLLALPALADDDEPPLDLPAASKYYETSLRRKALVLRTQGIEKLAATGDPRALKVLLQRYAQPDAPPAEVQHLIAGSCGHAFSGADAAKAMLDVARKARGPQHVWLWHQALRLQAAVAPDEVRELVEDKRRDGWLRAAGLAALAEKAPAAVPPAVTAALAAKGRPKGAALAFVAEAAADALARGEGGDGPAALGDDTVVAALGLVIDCLDDKELELRARVTIARALARALAADELFLEAEPWRRLLAAKAAAAKQGEQPAAGATRTRTLKAGTGVSQPRFFGVPSAGVRVVFVLDLSDSMLTPFSPDDLAALRRPRTGEPAGEDVAKLPWDRIKNRFDACREGLKQSLGLLGEKNWFAVVAFGTKAEPLLAPRLLPATAENVKRMVDAIEALKPGAPADRRPHGTLKGETNLDGGLRWAYRLHEKGAVAEHEAIAPEGFAGGADTIFVLSDGAPSWDDFECEDVRTDDWEAGDPETGESLGDSEELNYYGPYVFPVHLLRDVERLNLLRKVELHCVGVGEADPTLLEQLAKLGHGQVTWLGKRK